MKRIAHFDAVQDQLVALHDVTTGDKLVWAYYSPVPRFQLEIHERADSSYVFGIYEWASAEGEPRLTYLRELTDSERDLCIEDPAAVSRHVDKIGEGFGLLLSQMGGDLQKTTEVLDSAVARAADLIELSKYIYFLADAADERLLGEEVRNYMPGMDLGAVLSPLAFGTQALRALAEHLYSVGGRLVEGTSILRSATKAEGVASSALGEDVRKGYTWMRTTGV